MNKLSIKLLLILLPVVLIMVLSYIFILPRAVSSPKVISYVQKMVAQNCGAELSVTNPELHTSFSPVISFNTPSVTLTKDNDTLLNLKDFNIEINFSKLLFKKVKLNKLGAEEIFVDVNKIQKLAFKESKTDDNGKMPISFDCLHTLFYIKKCAILYETQNAVKMKLLARNLEVSDGVEPKFLHFGIYLDLFHDKQHLRLFFKDHDNVYFKNRKLNIDNLTFRVNRSKITLNGFLDEKHRYNINLFSDKFDIENVNRFLNTNLIIPNGKDITGLFKNFKGDFKFNIALTEKDLSGFMNVNKISADLTFLANLPLTVTKGGVTFDSKDIKLNDFAGYYGSNSQNKVSLSGVVKDYQKIAETKVTIIGTAYDEFAKYLSKLAGIKISLVKDANVVMNILCNAKGKVDVNGKVGLKSGSDILFEGASISPVKFYREIDMDLSLVKDILQMKHINYYIDKTSEKPLVQISGSVNAFTGFLHELVFDIPEPLPSEFFNLLIGQNIFRRGTFSGNMKYKFDKKPYLEGKMELKDASIRGQFFLIKNMTLEAKNDIIKILSDGILRRAKYNFDADIVNNLVLPVSVKNINLSFDEIDAEKIMKTFAPRPPAEQRAHRKMPPPQSFKISESEVPKEYFVVEQNAIKENTNTSEQIAFQPDIIEISNCLLHIKKGIYKQINFGNLNANMTLSRKGKLEIKSNKFDFAQGTSSLNVDCDLLKELYSIKLEANGVDTDAIATSVLNLSKEISGNANASMEFNTDNSMKLNGKIQFEVLNGSITKLGLVQYLLNMASIFRNPLAMISPSTLVDLVNVPDGSFNKINGRLRIKDNNISSMIIKSSSSQLSAFIVGSMNLETMDAALRIYTKFNNKHTGVLGFLRGFSLNSIAQKASKHTKDNRESYYASELSQLPPLETGEETAQVFMTQIDGDIQSTNFLSALKKIK